MRDEHDGSKKSGMVGDKLTSDFLERRWSEAAKAMSKLSETRDLEDIVEVLRGSARAAVGANGISVVLRDGDQCHFYAEDGMGTLWKGHRLSLNECVSGWAMLNRQSAAIPDVSLDDRIPKAVLAGTFVKSMLMVPIGETEPVAALGAYWDTNGHPDANETAILEALGQASSTALANGRLVAEMTELNRDLEARIEKRTKELEEAHQNLLQTQKLELMGQLTGNVAHDFNNLLSPIMTSLDLILQAGSQARTTQDHVQMAMEAVESARALVQRLLAFARRQPLVPAVVDLRALLQGMEALLASTVGPRIQLQIIAEPKLPNISADRQQLEMAILNLVVNARDAMPEGGILTISVGFPEDLPAGCPQGGPYVRLTILDRGEGMDEATRAMALEPFFTTKAAGSGTGLGLSMVHGVVQQIGGAIDIKSELGIGTQVSLWLPVTHSSVATLPAAKFEEPGLQVRGIGIVVDDHPLVRKATAAMLQEEGYKVIEVESAEACLAKLDDGIRPEILITDHMMPRMTGLDLAQKVAQSHPQIPIVLVSGYDGLEATPFDVVRMSKPFRQHELQASIAKARRQVQSREGGAAMNVDKIAS